MTELYAHLPIAKWQAESGMLSAQPGAPVVPDVPRRRWLRALLGGMAGRLRARRGRGGARDGHGVGACAPPSAAT